jgi:hypothetical protein
MSIRLHERKAFEALRRLILELVRWEAQLAAAAGHHCYCYLRVSAKRLRGK